MSSLDFSSLVPIEIYIPIMGKHYRLREASAGAAAQYKSQQMKAGKWSEDGRIIGVDGSAAEVEPLLVSLCLYRVDGPEAAIATDDNGNPDPRHLVPIQQVKAWPNRIQQALYDKALEISDLKPKASKEALLKQKLDAEKELLKLGSNGEDEVKNLSMTTGGGSG
jgi:hypothetical protein